jgi:plastocyanin
VNKNLMIGIIAVAVFIVGAWFLYGNNMTGYNTQTVEKNTTSTPSTEDTKPLGSSLESTDSSITKQVKEFSVTGSSFKFDPPETKVKKGDTVKITFKNAGGFHDFVIDEFKVKAKQGNGPSEEIITFVADKAGEFAYYCSVGQHRSKGMEGKFIVE